MHLPEAHRISNGVKTLVAVIDSGIDSKQPEIAGTITESFDAIDGANRETAITGSAADGMVHGTEVAGNIASHAALTGVAPQAHLLAVRAFAKGGGKTAVLGTTYDILAGTEWAVKHKARVVNMSFAGPRDPDLSREVAEGTRRSVIFVAAVGNEGKAAKPSYPAAYDNGDRSRGRYFQGCQPLLDDVRCGTWRRYLRRRARWRLQIRFWHVDGGRAGQRRRRPPSRRETCSRSKSRA
jgi:subtilisin family serine protease